MTVDLANINDNNPRFAFATTSFSIPEDAADGLFVADIPVTDPDQLDEAIELLIVGGDGADRGAIVDGRLVTKVSAALHYDREALGRHNVLLKAIDRGNGGETRSVPLLALPSVEHVN